MRTSLCVRKTLKKAVVKCAGVCQSAAKEKAVSTFWESNSLSQGALGRGTTYILPAFLVRIEFGRRLNDAYNIR